MNTSKKYVVQ